MRGGDGFLEALTATEESCNLNSLEKGKMKKIGMGDLSAGILFLCLVLLNGPVLAISYDFNDGTNQGWTVQFNYASGESPAEWFDYTNYSGPPDSGLPPVIGPADPVDNHGAIVGSGQGGDSDSPSISSFASPVFAPEAMESLSAQVTLSTNEFGIADDINVFGQIGYKMEGSGSFFFGAFTPLNTVSVPGTGGGVQPLWTPLSMDIPDGVMVNQIFVNIHVYGNPLLDGTQNWVDAVTSTGGSQPPVPELPEPATMLLLGCGLAGLAGFARKLKK